MYGRLWRSNPVIDFKYQKFITYLKVVMLTVKKPTEWSNPQYEQLND